MDVGSLDIGRLGEGTLQPTLSRVLQTLSQIPCTSQQACTGRLLAGSISALLARAALLSSTAPCLLLLNSTLQNGPLFRHLAAHVSEFLDQPAALDILLQALAEQSQHHKAVYAAVHDILISDPAQGAWRCSHVLQHQLRRQLDRCLYDSRLRLDVHVPQLLRLALVLSRRQQASDKAAVDQMSMHSSTVHHQLDDSTSTKALQCPTISLESCSEPSTQQSKPPQPAAQPPDMPSPLAALTGKALAAALALLRDPAAFGHLLQLHLQTSPQQQQQQPQQTADPLQALLQAAVQQREADNTSNPAADLVSGTFAAQLEPELAAEVLLQLTEVLLAELAADSGATQESATGHVSWLSGFEQSERPICMADAQRQAMHDVLAIHRELHALLSTRQGQSAAISWQPLLSPDAGLHIVELAVQAMQQPEPCKLAGIDTGVRRSRRSSANQAPSSSMRQSSAAWSPLLVAQALALAERCCSSASQQQQQCARATALALQCCDASLQVSTSTAARQTSAAALQLQQARSPVSQSGSPVRKRLHLDSILSPIPQRSGQRVKPEAGCKLTSGSENTDADPPMPLTAAADGAEGHGAKRRRITPMSIKQEEGAARSPGSDESADDSHPLCREFGGANEAAEAYWEDYIQGKMDLVIDILQENSDAAAAAEDPEHESQSAPARRSPRSSSGLPTCERLHDSHHAQPVHTASASWLDMHAAAVSLLQQLWTAQQGVIDSKQEDVKEALMQMLLDLISEGERQKSAHAAAKFLDASLSRQAYSAAIKGASQYPRGSIILCLTVRLQQMLSKAAADSIEQHADAAVASYLVLLAFIGQRAYTELAAAASAPTGHVTQPARLANAVVQTLMLEGSLCLDSLQPGSIKQLLHMLLITTAPHKVLAFAACTLWALSQGSFAVLGRPCPACCAAICHGWLGLWRSLSGTQHRREAMVMLLNRLKTHLDAHVNAATQPAAAGDAEQTNETHADGAALAACSMLDCSIAQPLTDALAAVSDAIVREASHCGSGSLASRELLRALLKPTIQALCECLRGVRSLQEQLTARAGTAGQASTDADMAKLAVLQSAGATLALTAQGLAAWHKRCCPDVQPQLFRVLQAAVAEMQQPQLLSEALLPAVTQLLSCASPQVPVLQGHLQPALAYARRQHTYVEELRKPSEPAKAASRPGQGGDAASGEDSSSSDSEAEASGDASLQSDSGMSSGAFVAKSRNSFVSAALAEGGQSGHGENFSELDDFIVCQEHRDYRSLFASEFRYAR